MAIVSVGLFGDSASVDKDGKVSIKTRWKVVSDDKTDSSITILGADGLPPYYSSHPDYDEAVANVYSATRIEEQSSAWWVEITFNTPDDAQQHADPTQDVPTIDITTESYQVAASDISGPDGAPITNSFGDPYDPCPSATSSVIIISIKRNEDVTTDVPSLISQYQDHLNSLDFWTFSSHKVYCKSINGSGVKVRNNPDGSVYYYIEMTYVFAVLAKRGFDLVLLDQGATYRDANGNPQSFKTLDGVPKIGLLDNFGGAATGGPPIPPVFLSPITIYPTVDFHALGLPEAFTDAIPYPTGFLASF